MLPLPQLLSQRCVPVSGHATKEFIDFSFDSFAVYSHVLILLKTALTRETRIGHREHDTMDKCMCIYRVYYPCLHILSMFSQQCLRKRTQPSITHAMLRCSRRCARVVICLCTFCCGCAELSIEDRTLWVGLAERWESQCTHTLSCITTYVWGNRGKHPIRKSNKWPAHCTANHFGNAPISAPRAPFSISADNRQRRWGFAYLNGTPKLTPSSILRHAHIAAVCFWSPAVRRHESHNFGRQMDIRVLLTPITVRRRTAFMGLRYISSCAHTCEINGTESRISPCLLHQCGHSAAYLLHSRIAAYTGDQVITQDFP